jgi:hypothetical protein
MAEDRTSVGLVVRHQGWFRAHVDPATLSPFPSDAANSVPVLPTGVFRSRVLIGRGPLQHDLFPAFLPWFDHGEDEYPIFQSPSIGPRGAALRASTKPRTLNIATDEAVSLVEISVVQPVAPTFAADYQAEAAGSSADPQNSASSMAIRLLTEAKKWFEQAVGLYALYQYPIVWEPLQSVPLLGFVNIADQTFQQSTPMEIDNLIPFRLNASTKVQGSQLLDGALTDLGRLENERLHLPLVLLQRGLWQRNVEVRFLETFWIIDYLTSQFTGEDSERPHREQMYAAIEAFIKEDRPQDLQRVRAMKFLVLQASLRQRIAMYLAARGVECDDAMLGRLLKLRNDLAHAHTVEPGQVALVELETRSLARAILRQELAARGLTFALPPGDSVG